MPEIGTGPAILWWVGLAVVFLVVLPAVVAIAHGIVRSARQIRDYARDVDEHVAKALDDVEPLQELQRTRTLAAQLRDGADRLASRLAAGP